jgi:hypothetical protein
LRPAIAVLSDPRREQAVVPAQIFELRIKATPADDELGALCDAVGVSA